MRKYFYHYTDIRTTPAMRRAIAKHGEMAYNIYFSVLERLREERFLSVGDYNLIASDLHVSSSLVKSVIEDFGLFTFTEDGKRFYSEEISELIAKVEKTSQARAMAGRAGGLANAKQMQSKCLTSAEHEHISKDITIQEDISKDKNIPSNEGCGIDNKLSTHSLHTRAKELFLSFCNEHGYSDYYFEAANAKNLSLLLNKLKNHLKKNGIPVDDDTVLAKFSDFIVAVYKLGEEDNWYRDHFTIPIMNSKYNDICITLSNKKNKPKNGTDKRKRAEPEQDAERLKSFGGKRVQL